MFNKKGEKDMNFTIKTLAVASALSISTSNIANATNLTASNWLPPSYAQSIHAYKNMFERLREKSGGEINTEVFYSGALLPAKTTIQGVRDGVADIGILYPAYTPAELPVESLINSVNFTSQDSLVAALAYTEMGMTNKALKNEFNNFNVVFTGAFVTPSYNFMCNTEVNDLAEAKGKRFRTAGASFTGLADKLNGTAVSVPIGDVYSGMQRGNLDCVMADPTNLTAASLNEVVKNITILNMGGATGVLWVTRKDSWQGLSENNRKLMLDEMMYSLVATHAEWDRQVDEAFDDAKKRGITIQDAEADLKTLLANYQNDFLGNVISDAKGVDNPAEISNEYQKLQLKWAKLLEGIDRKDVEAVTAVVKSEIFSKIDTQSFGL